ncbi:MAG: EamA family transporter RarD [Candidatus Aminicenantaceae bacterium]
MNSEKRNEVIGTWYAIAAFTTWGFLPIYWKLLKHVPSSQILAHRIIWSFLFLSIINSIKKNWHLIKKTYSVPKNRLSSVISAVILGTNWFIYIWAVNSGHIVESSLGYFINPLVTVLLGIIFLKERLKFIQSVAFLLAFTGVLFLTIQHGQIPWISLSLALTFGFYGLLRKISHVGSLTGITTETAILSPLVLLFLIYKGILGTGVFGTASLLTHLLLAGAGIMTATPLLWFTYGARRIPLTSIGFIQYLAPTFQLFCGVVIYKEAFTSTHLISFSMIWTALLIYSFSNINIKKRIYRK